MNLSFPRSISGAMLLVSLMFTLPSTAQAQTAYESVVESTDVLLTRLKDVQPIYADDPERFFGEVQNALDPYIDFEGFARGVMAKHYRSASEEQRIAFQEKFRQSLVRTYATALLEFDNQEVIV